jgi:predicted metal-dependent hydrolase
MAVKAFEVEAVGTVHVYKRKGTKSLRLSIASDGKVRVTVPFWATYADALKFVDSKSQWIRQNLPVKQDLLRPGIHIGKAHKLIFDTAMSGDIRTRLAGSEIRITRPIGSMITDEDVQQAAHKACLRALRAEAQKLLPVRLKQLADKYGFAYNSVQIKQLKGRWGSCDSHQHITLNLFLMQLPWHLIDYVLLHELTHTKHLDHSADFWKEFVRHEPRAKVYRKAIRLHKPILETANV